MLEPIINNGNAFEVLEKESQELDHIKQIIPAYFAEKHNTLLQHAITNKNTDIEANQDRIDTLNKMINGLREKEITLNAAKNKDELNSRVASL